MVFKGCFGVSACCWMVSWCLQVVEITKGSKVKYELDKKTGMIKVWTISLIQWPWLNNESNTSYYLAKKIQVINVSIFILLFLGWSHFVFISCLSSQLWFHSSYSMWRQWSNWCLDPHAGNFHRSHFKTLPLGLFFKILFISHYLINCYIVFVIVNLMWMEVLWLNLT